jgi:hypothetical protein
MPAPIMRNTVPITRATISHVFRAGRLTLAERGRRAVGGAGRSPGEGGGEAATMVAGSQVASALAVGKLHDADR